MNTFSAAKGKNLPTGDLVLEAIIDNGALSGKKIAKYLKIEANKVSSAIFNLKKSGYLQHVGHNCYDITDLGEERARKAMEKLAKYRHPAPDPQLNQWHKPEIETAAAEISQEPEAPVAPDLAIDWQKEYITLSNKLVDAIGRLTATAPER